MTWRCLGFVLVRYGPTVVLYDLAIYNNTSVGSDGSHSGDPSGFFHLKGKPAALPRFWGRAGSRQVGRLAPWLQRKCGPEFKSQGLSLEGLHPTIPCSFIFSTNIKITLSLCQDLHASGQPLNSQRLVYLSGKWEQCWYLRYMRAQHCPAFL